MEQNFDAVRLEKKTLVNLIKTRHNKRLKCKKYIDGVRCS